MGSKRRTIMRLALTVAIVAALAVLPGTAFAESLVGRAFVIDGDTIEIRGKW